MSTHRRAQLGLALILVNGLTLLIYGFVTEQSGASAMGAGALAALIFILEKR